VPSSIGKTLKVTICGVPAMHKGKHTVASRLQRVVEVFADRRALSHGCKRFGPHVFGMWTREPHTPDAVDISNRCQQVGEEWSQPCFVVTIAAGGTLKVTSIRVYVLPEQGDLAHSIGCEAFDFGNHVIEWAGDFFTANRWNDAKCTVVIATNLDRDPGCVGNFPPDGQRRWE
jgi:hypothetical protein